MTYDQSIAAYIKEVALKIRAREAEMLRGKPEQLSALEHQSDLDVVRRWAWTAAIVGALAAFIAAPFFLGVFSRWLPDFFYQLLWFILKLGMACVVLMFGAAAWLTFKPPSEV